jgi:hypothetical protein
VEGHRRTENLEGFEPSKISKELAQNSARSAEKGREQSKSQAEKVLSVSKEEGLVEVPKEGRIIHRQEETGGKRSGDPGVGAPGCFPRANRNLHEVARSGLNPDRWIWKGRVEVIAHFGGVVLQEISEGDSGRLLKARVQIDHSHRSEGGTGTVDPRAI